MLGFRCSMLGRALRRALVLGVLATASCGRVAFEPSFDGGGASLDATASDAGTADAGVLDAADAQVDAGVDSGTDAGPGATIDGGTDAGTDAGAAVTTDGGSDGGTDAGADAGPGTTCGDLRLYYRFEEASGPVLDESGCANHGAPTAVTTREPGRIGSAYRFNQPGVTTAHVLVPDSPSLSALSGLTVEAWVRHTGGSFETIVGHGNLMGGDPFVLHTYSSRDPALSLGNYPSCSGVASFRSLVTLPVDAWTHVAVTLDTVTNTIVFYSDGVETHREVAPYGAGPMCDDADAMHVGASLADGTWGWEGWIDDLRIWGVVRTQAQICMDAGGTPAAVGACTIP